MPLSEKMKAEGWIEHDGGECPVDGKIRVTMLFRNGTEITRQAKCEEWPWEENDALLDIIAYKPEATHD